MSLAAVAESRRGLDWSQVKWAVHDRQFTARACEDELSNYADNRVPVGTFAAVRSESENTLHGLAAFLDIGGYGTQFQACAEPSETEKREAQINFCNLRREVDTGMLDVGVGVAESLGAGAPWSPRCLGRLPHLARRAFLVRA